MPFLFVSVIFIDSCVYLPVRTLLRAHTGKLFMFCFSGEHLKNKTNGKIRLYSTVFCASHII